MEKPEIICVDDEREVLAALKRDLAGFKDYCNLTYCESAEEAQEVLEDLDAEGRPVALIVCDHIMPGKNGVDFLIELNKDSRFARTKKLLLTGLATQQDTIQAINQAQLDRYIEKPWAAESLIQVMKVLLTEFVVGAGMDYSDAMEILDQPTLYKFLRRQT
ncbi:MAG: response regulator [Calditrichaeota bacterium]|nr:response regulator [Calditrichota bacterium]MCB0298952.1 response regulator [Calditrichota bacterium]MCB9067602.1 response regulator [Calditrichia bacterium]